MPTLDVKAGMELFTYYGYKRLDFPSDYLWYWETLLALEKEEQKKKNMYKNSHHKPKNLKRIKRKKK